MCSEWTCPMVRLGLGSIRNEVVQSASIVGNSKRYVLCDLTYAVFFFSYFLFFSRRISATFSQITNFSYMVYFSIFVAYLDAQVFQLEVTLMCVYNSRLPQHPYIFSSSHLKSKSSWLSICSNATKNIMII